MGKSRSNYLFSTQKCTIIKMFEMYSKFPKEMVAFLPFVFQEKYHQQQLDVHRVFCTIKKHLREKQINFSIFFLQRFFRRIKSSNTPSRFRGFCFRWLIFTVLVKGFGAARLKLGQNFRRSKLNSAKIHSCNLYPVSKNYSA